MRQAVVSRDRKRLAVAVVDLYARLKDWDQVITMGEELLESNSAIVPVIERLDEALVATGQLQSAIQRYQSLTQLQPKNSRLWLPLAKTQIQVEDPQAAKASLDHALRASPPTGLNKKPSNCYASLPFGTEISPAALEFAERVNCPAGREAVAITAML